MTLEPLPLRDYQEGIITQAQELLRQDPSLMITAPTGAGKCHPAGTRILMHDGTILNIEKVSQGDLLMGPDGKPRRVNSTSTGSGQIVEIQPAQGEPWRCNDQHILTLAENKPAQTLTDISVEDYRRMAAPRREAQRLVRIPGILSGNLSQQQEGFSLRDIGPDRYYGFTLGQDGRYLLADGTITHNTVIIAEIAARAIRQNRRVGLLVHRQELVKQSREKIFQQTGMEPGVVWQSTREWDRAVTILAQDTLASLEIPWLQSLDLLMIDEAHHTVAPSWINTIERIHPLYLIGFSATPFRQDKEPLSPKPFANVIRPISPKELIDRDVLCRARIESPVVLDHNGDLQPISQASNPENIYLQAVRYAIGKGRNKIILYVSQTRLMSPLQVIRKTAERLRQNGIITGAIAQNNSSKQREATFERFQNTPGASVLLNYMALTEGTDLPCVDCVIIGRHTESESTIIQMIGRGLRKHENKQDCLVIDYTGRPDMSEIIHYWRLDGPPEEKEKSKRQWTKSNTPDELNELATRFPQKLSSLDDTRIQYPWFRPFPGRSLLALPLWSEEDQTGRYVTVEPLRRGGWRVTRIVLHDRGPSPVSRDQNFFQSAEDAARKVRQEMGQKAPQLERSASWRLKPASPAQQRTWGQLHPDSAQNPRDLTSGETWDDISRRRFENRVNPKLL